MILKRLPSIFRAIRTTKFNLTNLRIGKTTGRMELAPKGGREVVTSSNGLHGRNQAECVHVPAIILCIGARENSRGNSNRPFLRRMAHSWISWGKRKHRQPWYWGTLTQTNHYPGPPRHFLGCIAPFTKVNPHWRNQSIREVLLLCRSFVPINVGPIIHRLHSNQGHHVFSCLHFLFTKLLNEETLTGHCVIVGHVLPKFIPSWAFLKSRFIYIVLKRLRTFHIFQGTGINIY